MSHGMLGRFPAMPERPLSIVHITAPAPVGGLERVVQSLATGHHRAGHRVLVIAVLEPNAGDHPFVRRLQDDNVPVEVISVPAKGYWAERRAVRGILSRVRPDVVHTHGYRSDLLDGGVARSLGIPVVSTMHGSSRLGGRTHFLEWIQLYAWRRFDAVVAVSTRLEEALRSAGVAPERVAMIPNAWPGIEPGLSRTEARERLALSEDNFVIGFVGRLIPAKGPDILLQALLKMTGGRWYAVLVGEGILRPQLEAMIAEMPPGIEVRLVGHLDDATHLYRAFDLFALSSRTEGTPIALFEAIAAGVPVVAAMVGGVPEVVSVDEAILVDAEAPAALAQAISEVRGSPVEAARRAVLAKARLEREFAPEQWLRRHEELYGNVCARSTRRAVTQDAL